MMEVETNTSEVIASPVPLEIRENVETLIQEPTCGHTEESEKADIDTNNAEIRIEEIKVEPATTATTTSSTDSNPTALKVIFLSSDTGGGHRASAESLARQFELLYPGSTYKLVDGLAEGPPYNAFAKRYQFFSAHPQHWRVFYNLTNNKAIELLHDTHFRLTCERQIRNKIQEFDPDVVISVHPLMTNVPLISCQKISEEQNKHLPMYTVVTDLGSGHGLWFCNGVDKMFIASEQIKLLAKVRGRVPDEKLIMIGLPIRNDFLVQSKALGGDRTSLQGRIYQKQIRADELDLPFVDRRVILCMGGGEGVGSLSEIVNALYVDFVHRGIHATILVICGRNEKLKEALNSRDWDGVVKRGLIARKSSTYGYSSVVGLSNCWNAGYWATSNDAPPSSNYSFVNSSFWGEPGCFDGAVTLQLKKMLSTGYSEHTNNAIISPVPDVRNDDSDGESTDSEHVMVDRLDLASFIPFDDSEVEVTCVEGIHEDRLLLPSTLSTLAISPAPPERHGQVFQSNSIMQDEDDGEEAVIDTPSPVPGRVNVIPLGFIKKMASYMVAADVLVTKAGPGTIAEAASVGLPVMLTSFLPGQEEGNVDFVVKNNFGAYCPDSDPTAVAKHVSSWLADEKQLSELSRNATKAGAPDAAARIVKNIGDETLEWKRKNEMKSVERGVSED